jgi:hypothetical protein
MGRDKFWMVLGKGEPVYRHASKADAAKEAERLARLCPGQAFTVLEAVATVVVNNVQWDLNDVDCSFDDACVPF